MLRPFLAKCRLLALRHPEVLRVHPNREELEQAQKVGMVERSDFL
jgi:hypothetical protein